VVKLHIPALQQKRLSNAENPGVRELGCHVFVMFGEREGEERTRTRFQRISLRRGGAKSLQVHEERTTKNTDRSNKGTVSWSGLGTGLRGEGDGRVDVILLRWSTKGGRGLAGARAIADVEPMEGGGASLVLRGKKRDRGTNEKKENDCLRFKTGDGQRRGSVLIAVGKGGTE